MFSWYLPFKQTLNLLNINVREVCCYFFLPIFLPLSYLGNIFTWCIHTTFFWLKEHFLSLRNTGTSQNGAGISEVDSSQSITSHSSSRYSHQSLNDTLLVNYAAHILTHTCIAHHGPCFFRFTIDYSSLVEARAGQTAKLQCTVLPVSAIHAVTIHWSRAGQPLNSLRCLHLHFSSNASEQLWSVLCTWTAPPPSVEPYTWIICNAKNMQQLCVKEISKYTGDSIHSWFR